LLEPTPSSTSAVKLVALQILLGILEVIQLLERTIDSINFELKRVSGNDPDRIKFDIIKYCIVLYDKDSLKRSCKFPFNLLPDKLIATILSNIPRGRLPENRLFCKKR
jgi:hypothetical protein